MQFIISLSKKQWGQDTELNLIVYQIYKIIYSDLFAKSKLVVWMSKNIEIYQKAKITIP